MPRRSYISPTLAAAVRTHFKLTQAELARFVGVSRAHLAYVKAGRKDLAETPCHRLWVLARSLPPPAGQGPPAPLADTPEVPSSLAPGPVQARLQRARFYLLTARYELAQRGSWHAGTPATAGKWVCCVPP